LPYFDEVVHRIIDDSNTLLAALINEEVDLATQDGLDITQFDALEAAKADGRIEPYYVSGTVWEHVDFNLDPTDERAPVGACTQVRKAIALGTNRQVMVDEIQRGKTLVQHSFVPEEHWAYPESGLVTYDFDPEQAMQILDELGFQDADGDGVREAQTDITCTIGQVGGTTKDQIIPAGTPLTFVLNTTQGNEMRTQTTLLFQQNMKDIGVGVELEYLVSDVFFDTTDAGPLTGRRFDLAQFAWLTGVQPPVALYYCENVPSPDNSWAGQNSTGWCNPDYDRLAKLADTTLERAAALPSYAEAQAIFSDELPVLPLFARVKVMATRPGLMNFQPNATVNSETWNIETWGFAPEQ
jgi:peptide/nickel transport system substrate-binding protein